MADVLIRTANDAVEAFLREQISEKDLQAAVDKFGRPSLDPVHPPDRGFERNLPDFVYPPKEGDGGSYKERQKIVDLENKVREDALKAAEAEKGNLAQIEAERAKAREEAEQEVLAMQAKRVAKSAVKRP